MDTEERMTTDKQIIKQARKYFWQQKREEVVDYFEENWHFPLIISIFLGTVFQGGWIVNEETGLPNCKALAIVGLCILGFWILIGLIALIKVIVKWIKSNWKKALRRARDENEKNIKVTTKVMKK